MIRAKTKRRLVLVLAGSVAVAAVLGGAYAWRRSYQRAQAFAARDRGLAAVKAGDYEAALPDLYQYWRRYPDDAAALHDYALARQAVPEPDGGNLTLAMHLWRQYLALKPDDLDAQHRLLSLYVLHNANSEALDSAAAILKRAPEDAEALRGTALALYRLRRFADAGKTIARLNALRPGNFDDERLALAIDAGGGATADQIVAEARELRKKYPEDSNFALLESLAQTDAGHIPEAVAAARAAAAGAAATPQTLRLVLNQLDVLGLYGESLAAARAAAAGHPAAEYRRILAARLFLAGDYGQVEALLKNLSAADAAADGQLLAIQGMCLAREGRLQEAEALFQAVRSRPRHGADPVAGALAAAAEAAWLAGGEATARVEACREALQADPGNAFLHYFLGEALALSPDPEGAMREWRAAIAAAPAWGLPWTRCARTLLDAGRVAEALAAARAAQARSPDDQDAAVAAALAWSAAVNPDDAGDAGKLLDFLRDIRKRFPNAEEARPLLANLLARLGRRDEALKEFQAALDVEPAAREATLLDLAAVSRLRGLGREADCFARSEKAHGMTPSLALAKAAWLAQVDPAQDALSFFEGVMPRTDASAAWRLAYARLLSLTEDPRAKGTWIAVADAFPQDTRIQWAALTAPALRDDREFRGRIIQRLRDELGPDNIEGRMAQALWLLQGRHGGKETSEAAVILNDITRAAPNLVEPRILLADCLEELGNTSAAVEQLRFVARARPQDGAVALRLAGLLIRQGENDAAREQLARLAQSLPPAALARPAAGLYLSLGDRDQAAELLEKQPDAASGVLLAQIYLQRNQADRAEALCRGLLAAPTPGLIGFYASLLASEGRGAEAQEVLGRLEKVAARPGERELARAGYLARFGKPEEALAQYVAAARAAPKEAGMWRALLGYCVRTGRVEDVKTYAPEAAAAVPGDTGLAALRERLAQWQELASNASAAALFAALLEDPANSAAIGEAIQLAAEDKKGASAAQGTARVRQLAERYSKVAAVQIFAVEFLQGHGRREEATELSVRAMTAFPGSGDMARINAGALAAAGRWTQAVAAADEWRRRQPEQALQADVFLAAVDLQLGNPDAGVRRLEPYVADALKKPDDNPSILTIYAQDLIAARRIDRAGEVLGPLLTSPRWRGVWLNLSLAIADPAARGAWIERVAAAIPEDALHERVALAGCYQQFAATAKDAAWAAKARALADALAARPDLAADDIVALGSLVEGQNDVVAAEQLYRRALKINPNQAVALNNLAMILLQAKGDLAEAASLAARAVKAAPIAAFYDTQASVLAGQKSYDGALASIEEALKLEPGNAEWQATRIVILAQANRGGDAAAQFQKLKTSGGLEQLSASTRQRLASAGLQ